MDCGENRGPQRVGLEGCVQSLRFVEERSLLETSSRDRTSHFFTRKTAQVSLEGCDIKDQTYTTLHNDMNPLNPLTVWSQYETHCSIRGRDHCPSSTTSWSPEDKSGCTPRRNTGYRRGRRWYLPSSTHSSCEESLFFLTHIRTLRFGARTWSTLCDMTPWGVSIHSGNGKFS